jgi:hypothetical protein
MADVADLEEDELDKLIQDADMTRAEGRRLRREVRKMPSWPRSRANFSLLQLYSHRNTRANLHLLGQPNTFLARGARGGRNGGGAREPASLGVLGPSGAASTAPARLALDVKVILTPLCIFH